MKNEYEEFHDLQAELSKLMDSGTTGYRKKRHLRALREKYQSPLAKSQIDQLLRQQKNKAAFWTHSLIGFLLVITVFASFYGLFRLTEKAYRKPAASEELILQAVDDYEAGEYREVIRKLTACEEAGFDGFVVYQYLADSYYALGQVDQAVILAADYLENVYGTVNVEVRNVLYKRILAWLPETSMQVQTDLEKFLHDADRYSSLYEELREIARNPKRTNADRRVLELKLEGADNVLFYELYADYCWRLDKPYEPTLEEIKALVSHTDTYHGRRMTYEERWSILAGFAVLYDADTLQLADFQNRADEFAACGTGITDSDPRTGRNINGKLEDSAAIIQEAKEVLKAYDFIRSNPYLDWPEYYFFDNGNEVLTVSEKQETASSSNRQRHSYTLSYSWMDGMIYQCFPGTNYSVSRCCYHYAQLNTDPVKAPEKLVGTWKSDILDTSQIIVVRKVDGQSLEIGIFNSQSGAEMLPFTWVTFQDNHAVVEYYGWKFELVLAKQLWQIDEDYSPIAESEDIDAILLEDIDCTFPVSYEGIYLKESDAVFENNYY